MKLLPTAKMRYSELLGGLNRSKKTAAREYFGLSSEVVDYKNSILGLGGSESVFFYANTKAHTSYIQEVYMEGHVGFLFSVSGTNFLKTHKRSPAIEQMCRDRMFQYGLC